MTVSRTGSSCVLITILSVSFAALVGCSSVTRQTSTTSQQEPGTLFATAETESGNYEIIARSSEDNSRDWSFEVLKRRDSPKEGLRFEWDFGDGVIHSGPSQTFAFATDDTYVISVTGIRPDGRIAFVLDLTIEVAVSSNRPPVAVVSADQEVLENELVFLFAGESTDPDGDPITFAWTQTSGPPVNLLNANAASASFVAPLTETEELVQFVVRVSDGDLVSQAQTAITVLSISNVSVSSILAADAGIDQSVSEGAAVVLDGAVSGDGGQAVNFAWVQLSGPSATLTNATSANATFNAPLIDVASATLVFQLTVTTDLASATDVVEITVNDVALPNTCVVDGDCDDGLFCTGNETCSVGVCASSGDPCSTGEACDEQADQCVVGQAISGLISNYNGAAFAGATLILTGSGSWAGTSFTITTAADGTYFQLVPVGWSGTVTSGADHRFEPASRSYNNVTSGSAGDDFMAFRNYYVDDDACVDPLSPASAGSGSLADPFCKIQQAANVVNAGDVVEIREGTYRSFGTQGSRVLNIQDKSGSSVSPIVFKNYDGEHVSLVGTGTSWQVVVVSDSSYINITGIKITGGSRGLLVFRSAHVLIDHVTIHGNGDGLDIRGDSVIASDHVTVSYCEIYNSRNTGILVGHRAGASKTFNTVIENCLIYDSGQGDPDSQGQGAYVSDASTGATQNTTFRNNIAFRNSSTQIGCENTFNCIVDNNIMAYAGINNWTDAGGNYGDGRGGKIGTAEGGEWNRNHLLRGNIIFGNNSVGYGSDNAAGNNYFYHNTIVGNGHCLWGSRTGCDGGVFLGFDVTTEMEFYNNIIHGNAARGDIFSFSEGLQHGSTLFGTAKTGFASSDTNGIMGQDPQFLDYDVFGIDMSPAPSMTVEEKLAFIRSQVEQTFGLRPTSPAIDKGVVVPGYHCPVSGDVNPNQSGCRMWYGSAPDIGAFEYNPGG